MIVSYKSDINLFHHELKRLQVELKVLRTLLIIAYHSQLQDHIQIWPYIYLQESIVSL